MAKSPISASEVKPKGLPKDPSDGVPQGRIRAVATGSAQKWERPADIPNRKHKKPFKIQDHLQAQTLHIESWRRHSTRATLPQDYTPINRIQDSYQAWCDFKGIDPVPTQLLFTTLGESVHHDNDGFYLTLIG